MNKSFPLYTTLILLLVQNITNAQCDCTPEQAALDSLSMLRFYQEMSIANGGWVEDWNTEDEVKDWHGVHLSLGNCVECIDLDGDPLAAVNQFPGCECIVFTSGGVASGNQLSGTWPDPIAIRLPCLKALSLSDNNLSGSMPDFSTSFPNLCQLVLRRTRLEGPILMDHLQLPDLNYLYLGTNKLTGFIPDEILSLTQLQTLYLNTNDLEGVIPDFSQIDGLDNLFLRENKFTFEDFLPNFTAIKDHLSGFTYAPQDSIFQETTFIIGEGLPFTIDLEVDEMVTSSHYNWSKNDADYQVVNVNKLNFDSITAEDVGVYRCEITNDTVVGLKLQSRDITIETCAPGVERIDTILCPGEVLIRGDLTFDQDSIHIFRGEAANGCDSAFIVDIEFLSPFNNLDTAICAGTEFYIANEAYGEGQHTITLLGASQYGCDSTIYLNLEYVDTSWGMANIGSDTVVCQPEITINANLPPRTSGSWRNPEGIILTDESSNTGMFSNLQVGENRIGWILGAGGCTAYDSSFIQVYYEPRLNANDHTILLLDGVKISLEFSDYNLLDQNSGIEHVWDQWMIELIEDTSTPGLLEIDEDGMLKYTRELRYRGTVIRQYVLSTNQCLGDTAQIVFDISPLLSDSNRPPNVITPNGDGLNDTFVIPIIQENILGFPNSHLWIYDINNSELLYEIQNYKNDWEGIDFKQNLLRANPYRFVIDYGNGYRHEGIVSIIRSD